MSFAVIQTGGKQYKVSASEILKIERLNDQEGKTVEFKNVLFLNKYYLNRTSYKIQHFYMYTHDHRKF